MDGPRNHFPISETRAHAQVLSEEVRTYLLHHGGSLEVSDEAALDTFAERFLLPSLAAAWSRGHRTVQNQSDQNQSDQSQPTQQALNPYRQPGRARGLGEWWQRLRLDRHATSDPPEG